MTGRLKSIIHRRLLCHLTRVDILLLFASLAGLEVAPQTHGLKIEF